jgi:hypothetical protein
MQRPLPCDARVIWMWGLFAVGFIFPLTFALFLPLALITAWQAFKEEYEEVAIQIKEENRSNRLQQICQRITL